MQAPFSIHNQDLRDEDPLRVLQVLLKADPKRSVGFFQKAGDVQGTFQPKETFIGFDPMEICRFNKEQNPYIELNGRNKFVLGYFSYDSVTFREPILARASGSFSKVSPDFTMAEYSVFEKLIYFDHRAKKLSFINQAKGVVAPEFEMILDQARALSAPGPTVHGPVEAELNPNQLRSSLGSVKFKAGVKKLQEHILAGDIFQAVLSEKFEVDLEVSPLEIFKTLTEIGPSAYQFYYATSERTVLGASPELLLSVKRGVLETHPIAGTRPRGKTPQEDLRNQDDLMKDTKENAEHLMLVDLARNDIGRIARPGSVRATERNLIKKFPSVMHIVSKVVGELGSGSSSIDALSSCSPAGTLSGAPKIRAMQLISEIENAPRGFYGGSFFVMQPDGDLEACISIRSMEVVGGRGYIQAGAGIVMDSNPDSEYEEVLHKTKTLRRAVAITNLKGKSK